MSFNTTLVQLKGDFNLLGIGVNLMFQYHTGPIKSSRRRTVCIGNIDSFNTTLVQLKVYPTGGSLSHPRGFQYHTGPIKSSKTKI